MSIEENARGKEVYAISNDPIRIGVPLPSIDAVVKFKIVEVFPIYFLFHFFHIDSLCLLHCLTFDHFDFFFLFLNYMKRKFDEMYMKYL